MYQTRPPFLIYGFVLREYRTHSRLSIKHFQLDFKFIGCAAGGSYVRKFEIIQIRLSYQMYRHSWCEIYDLHVLLVVYKSKLVAISFRFNSISVHIQLLDTSLQMFCDFLRDKYNISNELSAAFYHNFGNQASKSMLLPLFVIII